MADCIVLYPSPGKGHLYSMLELGKLVSKHAPSLSVTIIIPSLPNETNSVDSIIAAASSSAVSFLRLPPVAAPTAPSGFRDTVASFFEVPQLNNPQLKESLISLSKSRNVRAAIIDFFCNPAVEVTAALGIPTYYFFTSGASALCSLLYTSTIDKEFTGSDLKNGDTEICCPGVPTMKPEHLPVVLLDRSHRVYQYFIDTSVNVARSAGIIANTFESLESTAVEAILSGKCTPAELRPPPLYCIGPVIGSGESRNEERCLSWLDSQPTGSVVFLCFGSMGVFSEFQLKEMAAGLEESGVRFLWVVRPPADGGKTKGELKSGESADFGAFLPEGFLDRTKDKGLVVENWAPQVKVLSHGSVGGFVTHCGWNSILESVCAGVPMLAWPLYAEQKVNELALVEELKLALRLTRSGDGVVSRGEFGRRLGELMNSEEGNCVRDRVKGMKRAAVEARTEGGSSHVAMAHLVESFGICCNK